MGAFPKRERPLLNRRSGRRRRRRVDVKKRLQPNRVDASRRKNEREQRKLNVAERKRRKRRKPENEKKNRTGRNSKSGSRPRNFMIRTRRNQSGSRAAFPCTKLSQTRT